MSEVEVAICARIKFFREAVGWPQEHFAYQAGASRDKLQSIEYGRTPVRYQLAKRICETFNISLVWLAKGMGSPQPFLPVPKEAETRIPLRMLFSKAFFEFVEPTLDHRYLEWLKRDEQTGATQILLSPVAPPKFVNGRIVLKAFKTAVESAPVEARADFHEAVLKEIQRVQGLHRPDSDSCVPLRASAATHDARKKKQNAGIPDTSHAKVSVGKLMVDTKPATDRMLGVSSEIPTWKQLVAALKRKTSSPGAKAQLAEDLKTSRQNVNKWLSGAGAPSAELTLRVFDWVQGHGGWQQN